MPGWRRGELRRGADERTNMPDKAGRTVLRHLAEGKRDKTPG